MDKEVIVFFKKVFWKEKKTFFKTLIIILISSLLAILYGYLIGKSITYATDSSYILAVLTLLLYLVLSLLDNLIFNRMGRIYLEKISNNMMEKISYEMFQKVGLLPTIAFEDKSSGELINRIISDPSTISNALYYLIRIIMGLFMNLVIFIYIFINSWVIALEVILYLVIFYLFSSKYLPKIKKEQEEITKEKDKVVASVNETIRGIREIRALGIRKSINTNVKNLVRGIYHRVNKQMVFEKNYNAFVSSLNASFEVIVFITCVILMYLGSITLAFFIAMTYYIYRFMNTINLIMDFSSQYQKMKVSIKRIDEILNNKLYKDEVFGPLHKTNITGNIEFKSVYFKYKPEENYVFEDLNLKLDTHKKIALVGKSGQGKTSIFNLLLRYFEPNMGVILIDDIPITDFDEDSLRQNIAIIRQEPFIFNKTILENLKMIDPYMSLRKIRNACKIAEIDEYVMSLPNKYDTLIGEGGINLSGGQKQRLAIARALLKNSRIILFDEATSALDNQNQAQIKKAIDNLVIDHTIIIVAHRLSTIIDADVIYLMDKGKIVARGTHKELLKKNKLYKDLYEEDLDS